MEIREATEHDTDAIRDVTTSAFGDDGVVADLVDDLRRSGRMLVELVAVSDDRVSGHVALNQCWIDDARALVPALVLSPLSVAPGDQRAGIGTRLVRAALQAAGAGGVGYVFLEGAPGWYGDRGFVRADQHGFLRPSDRIPAPAFQVVVLRDQGARGRVVYPDAFWAHDATGLRGAVLEEVRAQLGE